MTPTRADCSAWTEHAARSYLHWVRPGDGTRKCYNQTVHGPCGRCQARPQSEQLSRLPVAPAALHSAALGRRIMGAIGRMNTRGVSDGKSATADAEPPSVFHSLIHP